MTAPGGDPGRNPSGPHDPAAHYPPQYGPGFGYSEPGYPLGYEYGPPPRSGTNTMAVASLVTAVVGFAPYFGGILSIVGIVLGAVALNQIKQTPQDGYGLAVAGIVVGVTTLIIGLIWTIYAMR